MFDAVWITWYIHTSIRSEDKQDMNYSTVNLNITESAEGSSASFIDIMYIIEMCVCSINVLLGLFTHFYVMWLIVTGKGIASEFFYLNLSVCEIGNCVNCFSDILAIWFSSIKVMTYFLLGLGITGRPLFQCLICVERYLAVIHPVIFLKYKPVRYRVICCTAAWIMILGSCLFCLLMLSSQKLYIYISFFTVQFLIFLSIQLFCCLAVLRALKQSGPGERGRGREEENHTKRRAFHLILITTVNIVIIYLPYCISGFFVIFSEQAGKLSCFCSG
ncbi:C-C chemokine receptor type 8-like [Triplophysa rosa]|uniref:C-C chemokine receptor type 8-like n=1 Tax=Triplophysa rosa TaxID=992332 RepID=UPI0025461244|nr:C-C chemokine receptor type 8-like [Triplophysa rosa]